MLPAHVKNRVDVLSDQFPDISPRALRAYLEQYWFAKEIIRSLFDIEKQQDCSLLEIGPAEGGLLKYFNEKGLDCYGIELAKTRFENSLKLNPDRDFKLYEGDITLPESYHDYQLPPMDYIVLRDVIEHIPDRDSTLRNIYNLLKPGGKVYVSFPPKWAPYAGHQQTAERLLIKVPYLYLLPNGCYQSVLRVAGIPKNRIRYLMNTKASRLGHDEFANMAVDVGFKVLLQQSYFIRPEYEFRFGYRSMKNRIAFIPFVGHLFTNGMIIVLEKTH